MSNSGIVIFESDVDVTPCVYLHWNGSKESIQAFCEICKERGYRDPCCDPAYAMARFIGLVHEFFGIHKSTSLGVEVYNFRDPLRNPDSVNGVFLIGSGWKIEENFKLTDEGEKIIIDSHLNQAHYSAVKEALKELV